jgi:hypothetical protein
MTNLNCEYVREVYPDVLNNTADTLTAAAVRAHLAGCGECREEAELLDLIHSDRVDVPAGLHERVMSGVQVDHLRRRPYVRHLALAATVAAAVIGGSILFESAEPEPVRSVDGLGFVTVEAAMVSGASSLQDLTVEELEQLLGEIES